MANLSQDSASMPLSEAETVDAVGANGIFGTDDNSDAEKQPEQTTDPAIVPPPPNGGFVAWLQVAGAWFLFVNSWGIVTAFGVFQAYYEDTLLPNYSASTISWIGTVQGFLLLSFGIMAGPIFDKGYVRWMILFGTVMVVFGLMMTSLASEYYQIFLAHGVTVGIGCCFLFLPSVAVVSTYFTTKRSLAIGVTASGGSVGSVIYPIMFHRLLGSVGFPWATRILGFVALAGLVFSIAVIRMRVPPPSHARSFIDKTAFTDLTFLSITFSIFLCFLGLYFPFFYLPAFLTVKLHSSQNIAFYIIAILNAASAFGRIFPGLLADRIGPLNTVIPVAVITAALAFSWMGIHNEAGTIVFSILYGCSSGAVVSLPPTIIARFTPNMNLIGTRMGMCFAVAGVGLLIGNPIAGALLHLEKAEFWKAQLFAAVTVTAGATLYSFIRFYRWTLNDGWKM